VIQLFFRINVAFLFLVFILGFLLACIAIITISYSALSRMTFSNNFIRKGGHRAHVLKDIKPKLLNRSDIKQVEFKTEDNFILKGLWVQREKAVGNLLLCHGIHSNKEFLYQYVDMFVDYNILMFDFRGHGQSDGKFITIGYHEYKDVIAAANFLKTIEKNLPLIILGISMGGAAALMAMDKQENVCDALIIDSAFKDLSEIVYDSFRTRSKGLTRFPFFYILKRVFKYLSGCDIYKVKPIDNLKKINKPVLFIHSCFDKVVPTCNSMQMFECAVHDKSRLWIAPECKHARLHNLFFESYKKRTDKFLKNVLN